MSVYQEGRAAYHAQISIDFSRHWPTARRELWQSGWRDAERQAEGQAEQLDLDRAA